MGGLRKHIPVTYWMMVIGTLALTGVGIPARSSAPPASSPRTRSSRRAFVGAQRRRRLSPSCCWSIAAVFTSFYSWRLIFMTFHGKPRASHEVMHHVHESPPVMLVPLYILAVGALFAGFVFHDYFIGEGYGEFWKAALFTVPDNHILHEHPPRPALGEARAVHRDAARLRVA